MLSLLDQTTSPKISHPFWMIRTILFLAIASGCQAGYYESQIIKDLFTSNYSTESRPVANESAPITIFFEIVYSQTVDLDEKNQILTSNLWVRQKWSDVNLKWNPASYGDVSTINIEKDLVWKPDIVLYNNIHDEKSGAMYNFDTKVSLYSDGTVYWLAPVVVKSSCKLNMQYFPYDTQICKLVFGSWTYDGYRLDLRFKGKAQADTASYTTNGEWELISANAKRHVTLYSCCPEPYIDLTYFIEMKRLTLFYTFNLIVPCLVLATIVAFSFKYPPESGERLSLVITVMLGMTVFMLIVTETIPPTSEVTPLIGKFFAAILIEIALALLVTGIVLDIHHSEPSRHMPNWFKVFIFKFLAKVFRKKHHLKIKFGELERKVDVSESRKNLPDDIKLEDASSGIPSPVMHQKEIRTAAFENKANTSYDAVAAGIRSLCAVADLQKSSDQIREQWEFAAKIMDEFFFFFFILMLTITTLATFMGS